MSRVVFDYEGPVAESDPARADVACFVGLALSTSSDLPASIRTWLKTRGWLEGRFARQPANLLDIPIPIDNYSTFAQLFDTGGSVDNFGTGYLGAAVRSFFAQGGRRCYVVRMGDPVTPEDDRSSKDDKLAKILPRDDFAVDDRTSWHGAGHLGGLPDVSVLVLPDLPALAASVPEGAEGEIPDTTSFAQFEECTKSSILPPPISIFDAPAPRLTSGDYKRWAGAVSKVITFLDQQDLKEVQFVAAIPLPFDPDVAAASEMGSSVELAQDIQEIVQQYLPARNDVGSGPFRFLQLAYPWLRTTGSHALLEGIEPPDGVLAGLIAQNALTRGTFTDATRVTPAEVVDIWPPLPKQETTTPLVPVMWDGTPKPLIVRVSVFGFTPSGLRLLSDVTAFPGEDYRPARVQRLVAVIRRACRRVGDQMVFQNNGPAVWSRLQASLTQLMTRLWRLNALEGATIQDAFSVLCDRSTMTQNDIDNGRLVALASFTAAATIELIRVTLSIETSGSNALPARAS